MGRRVSTLLCLVLTALTLWLLPGSLRALWQARESRVPERLAPARVRLLTVWLLDDDTDSHRLLARLCSAFEKQRGDVRVRLRRADAADLTAEAAVRPDVLLFSLYTLSGLEGCLLPLAGELPAREEALCAGRSALRQLAVPLWFSPSVLAVPACYAAPDGAPQATPEPERWLLPLASAGPTASPGPAEAWTYASSPASHERIPWDALNALLPPEGVALPQLALSAPARLRAGIASRLMSPASEPSSPLMATASATPAPTPMRWPFESAEPVAAAKATPRPPITVQPYRAWRRSDSAAYALFPAACDRALLAGLCRAGDAAEALLRFLLSPFAQGEIAAEGLFSCAQGAAWPADTEAARALSAVYGPGYVLPNAFAHARQEALALCRAGLADPAATLLRLR